LGITGEKIAEAAGLSVPRVYHETAGKSAHGAPFSI
jgi:hypothetical protein